jgi:hypothetical protein
MNVSHLEMVKATGLTLWHQGLLQWQDPPTEFHKIPLSGSKVMKEDTQTL